jgi:hypothetical protein
MRGTRRLSRLADPFKIVDPLGDALRFLRLSGVFYCHPSSRRHGRSRFPRSTAA